MIATGGTIASKRTDKGLEPVLTSEELLRYVPEVRSFCEIETRSLLCKDSTEIAPQDWLSITRCIRERYDDFDGFVVCHGTDTMAYTSAALSYLIQNSAKPVVVTGAQQPIDMETTDARKNLTDSFLYAASDSAHGVSIVFDGDVIAGTRAKKTHTKSYNAFTSTNFPLLAVIQSGRVIPYISTPPAGAVQFFDALNTNVALFKIIPTSSPEALSSLLDNCEGIVIESFGTGGLPERFYETLERGVAAGKTAVITTQVPNEGSDMTIYHVGKGIKERLGLIEAYDMTLEALLTKLMWILGRTSDRAEIRREFYRTIQYDILIHDPESA